MDFFHLGDYNESMMKGVIPNGNKHRYDGASARGIG